MKMKMKYTISYLHGAIVVSGITLNKESAH